MNRDELIALAERVETATGGLEDIATHQLQHEVATAMHALGWHAAYCLRQFLFSIDAAVSIEPQGFQSEEIYAPSDDCEVWTSHAAFNGQTFSGVGNTRVLAQLASRLRALAGAEQ